mgnify:CR=1 FL=1
MTSVNDLFHLLKLWHKSMRRTLSSPSVARHRWPSHHGLVGWKNLDQDHAAVDDGEVQMSLSEQWNDRTRVC